MQRLTGAFYPQSRSSGATLRQFIDLYDELFELCSSETAQPILSIFPVNKDQENESKKRRRALANGLTGGSVLPVQLATHLMTPTVVYLRLDRLLLNQQRLFIC